MTKQRTPLERAAGKLILAVQQQWDAELGEPGAGVSEEVMHNSHDLISSAKDGSLQSVLRGSSVTDFLGRAWVRAHPQVQPAIKAFEEQMANSGHAQPTVQADGPASGGSAA